MRLVATSVPCTVTQTKSCVHTVMRLPVRASPQIASALLCHLKLLILLALPASVVCFCSAASSCGSLRLEVSVESLDAEGESLAWLEVSEVQCALVICHAATAHLVQAMLSWNLWMRKARALPGWRSLRSKAHLFLATPPRRAWYR